jgi:hypothetical protein
MRLVLLVAFLAMSGSQVFWACRVRLTDPAPQGLQLVIVLSSRTGDAAHPLDATAVVTNGQGAQIYHAAGCGSAGIRLRVRGPDGAAVRLVDPRVTGACADSCCIALAAGDRLQDALRFDGTLYAADGSTYPAPSGDYVVDATFDARGDLSNQAATTVTQETRFRWTGFGIRFGALTRDAPLGR